LYRTIQINERINPQLVLNNFNQLFRIETQSFRTTQLLIKPSWLLLEEDTSD